MLPDHHTLMFDQASNAGLGSGGGNPTTGKLWTVAIKPDAVRSSFTRVVKANGRDEATCPKSWRHSFATLLQDANVDPLIRQQTLGHRPTTGTGLGMTANYTHTRRETLREQIERALRRWPGSLRIASEFVADEGP